MITVSDVSVSFGGQLLFKNVDLKFSRRQLLRRDRRKRSRKIHIPEGSLR